jgi:vitamin K-dependent gamma-carboxylase-like protein
MTTDVTSPGAGVRPRRDLWSRWTALLNEWEPGTSLALFRIGCGLTVLATLATIVFHGLAPVLWLDFADGGYAKLGDPPWLFGLIGGVNPVAMWSMVAVAALSSLTLTIGFLGRISAFCTLQSYLALANINPHIGGADDQLIGNALWLLVLARSTATLSLDCRLHTGSWTSTLLVPAWPRYLAIFQLVLVYCTTGIQKLSITWTPAGGCSALYYTLQEPSWQSWDMSWLAWIYPLTQIATATTWLWEVTSPLLILALWYRRTPDRPGRLRALFNAARFRDLFVAFGILMHLGVWVLIGLGPFTWITLSFYVCLYTSAEWRSLGERCARWMGVARNRMAAVLGTSGRWPSSLDRLPARVWNVGITFHVVAVTLMAIPGVPAGVMTEEDWNSPVAQEEFASWTRFLNGIGFDTTPEALQGSLWDAAIEYNRVRSALLAPFHWYYTYSGARQGWRMFTAPCLEPTRLYIDIGDASGWRPVFGEGLPDLAWLGGELNHEHMRTALYTMVFFRYEDDLERFAHWVAVRAARDFPGGTHIRIRIHHFPTPTPEQVRENRRPPGRMRIAVTLPMQQFSR